MSSAPSFMFEALSVVIQASLSSFKSHAVIASLSPWAMFTLIQIEISIDVMNCKTDVRLYGAARP